MSTQQTSNHLVTDGPLKETPHNVYRVSAIRSRIRTANPFPSRTFVSGTYSCDNPIIATLGTFAAFAGLSFASLAGLAHLAPLGEGATAEPAAGAGEGGVAEIGRALFGPYALPFESASLLLLAAIVGAIVLAKKKAGES